MKNFKFLSALALTGMLSAGFVGTTFAAGATNWTGVLKQGSLTNVVDKDVAGILLSDASDSVTVNEILNLAGYTSIKLNGSSTDAAKTETVTTGNYYTAGNKTEKRHIVVYNEVNKDGKVSVDDVKYTLKMINNEIKDAEDLQKEAADVKHDGKINVDDAKRMLKFLNNEVKTPVESAPVGVSDVEELKYNILVNGGATVNAENVSKSNIVVATASGNVVDEPTFLKLVYVDDNGDEQSIVTTGIPAHSNQVDAQVAYDFSSASNLDTTEVVNKQATLRVYDLDNNLVGTQVITINTHTPEAVEISTTRGGSYSATLAFKGYDDSNIVKAYYTTTSKTTAASFFTLTGEPAADVKVLDGLSNGYNGGIDADLTTTDGATVYFIVEDVYGSRSTGVYTAVVPKDGGSVVKENPPVGADSGENKGKVTVSDALLATYDTSANPNGYVIRIYNANGKLIKEHGILSSDAVSTNSKDLSADITEPGTYTVKVFVKGASDGSKTDSDPISSEPFTVSRLASVTDVTITKDPATDENVVITWNDVEHSSDDKASAYEIKLEKFTGNKVEELTDDTKWTDSGISITDVNVGEPLTATATSLGDNTIYRASVMVKADTSGQKVVKSSLPTKSKTNYLYLANDVISVDTAGDTTATLKVDLTKLDGLEDIFNFRYDVKVFEGVDPSRPYAETTTTYRNNVKLVDTNVETTKNLIVDGLKPETNYVFVVTMTAGDVVGMTPDGTITTWGTPANGEALHATTLKSAPTKLDGVVASADVENSKTAKQVALANPDLIYGDASSVVIGGKEYLVSDFNKYADTNKVLARANALIQQLHPGDKLTVADKTATVKVDSKASEGGELALTLTNTDIETVKFVGNGYNQTITSLTGAENLILESGEFTLPSSGSLGGAKVTLGAGAHVLGATDVTLSKGVKDVKVNGINVYTKNETEVTANNYDLTFAPSANNDIVIDNETTNASIITFNGSSREGNVTSGTVSITTKGNLTVLTQAIAGRLNANLNITALGSAVVNVIDAGLTNVKVTANNTIVANAKAKLPEEFVSASGLVIKEYTSEELKASSITGLGAYAPANAAKLTAYLENFRPLFGKDATLIASKDNAYVYITPKANTSITVSTSDVLDALAK